MKNVNFICKKVKGSYQLRLATEEEAHAGNNHDNWRIPKADRPKCPIGFNSAVIYPPEYKENIVCLQSEKIWIDLNFKTGTGKLLVKGMGGYNGHVNSWACIRYGIEYDFNNCPEIIAETLKQLPSKGTLQDIGNGVIFTQY